jgi:hypothetical protein
MKLFKKLKPSQIAGWLLLMFLLSCGIYSIYKSDIIFHIVVALIEISFWFFLMVFAFTLIMKTLIYHVRHDDFVIEIFRLDDVNELTNDAYEIVGTDQTTKESTSLTTNTPQGAIALADNVINELEHSERRKSL